MQPAGDDQALHDLDVLGAEFGPAKQPAAPTHGNPAQRIRHVMVSIGTSGSVRLPSVNGVRDHQHGALGKRQLQSLVDVLGAPTLEDEENDLML